MLATNLIRIDIHANLGWNCFKTESGNWIAVCDPLKLTVQAETWADLMEDIGLTLDAMLRDLLSTNELEKFLREHGWTAVDKIPSHPDTGIRFDVPFIPAMIAAPAC